MGIEFITIKLITYQKKKLFQKPYGSKHEGGPTKLVIPHATNY